MDGLQCSVPVLRRLKGLAVSALNSPSSWTEEQVSDLGNIIGEITKSLITSSFIYPVFTRVELWKTRLHPFFNPPSAGLDAAELASLNPSAFSFIRESCVPLIPPSNVAVSAKTLNRVQMSAVWRLC